MPENEPAPAGHISREEIDAFLKMVNSEKVFYRNVGIGMGILSIGIILIPSVGDILPTESIERVTEIFGGATFVGSITKLWTMYKERKDAVQEVEILSNRNLTDPSIQGYLRTILGKYIKYYRYA